MHIQLIKGNFSNNEAIDLLGQLIQVKIKFHETQISSIHNEEDIFMRENRIKQLQDDFSAVRASLISQNDRISMDCSLTFND